MVKEANLAVRSIRTQRLSVESLLVHTISLWTRAHLKELQRLRLGDMEAMLYDSPAVLSLHIILPCLHSKQLQISVGTHTGISLAHRPQYPANPLSLKVQNYLIQDHAPHESLLTELCCRITALLGHDIICEQSPTGCIKGTLLFILIG